MQKCLSDVRTGLIANEGTAGKTSEIELSISGEKTGFFEITGKSRLVKCLDIVQIINESGSLLGHI